MRRAMGRTSRAFLASETASHDSFESPRTNSITNERAGGASLGDRGDDRGDRREVSLTLKNLQSLRAKPTLSDKYQKTFRPSPIPVPNSQAL